MTADYYYDRYRFFDETLITKQVWDTMMQQHGNRPPHNEEDCDAAPDDEEGSASGRLSGKRKRGHDGREASGNAGTGYASASRLAVGSSSTDTSGTTMQPAWMLNWQQLGGRVRHPSQTMAGTEIVPPSPLRVVVWPRSAPNSVPRRRLDDLAVEALGCLPALPCIVPPPICRVCVCVCVCACVCARECVYVDACAYSACSPAACMHACLLTCRMHLSDSIVALAPATGGCTKGEAPSDGRVSDSA